MNKKTVVCFLILLAILVTGCAAKETSTDSGYNPLRPLYDYAMDDSACNHVFVLHDDAKNVTVYVFDGFKSGGISVIPDWQLKSPEK